MPKKNQTLKHIGFLSCVLGIITLFSGCATDIKSLEKFAHTYYYQDAKQASDFALKKSDDKDLLWLSQAGVSAFSAGSENAIELLEKSENLFSKYEGEGLLAKGGAQVGAAIVNDNAMAYRGNMYEGVFLNYYKALAQMEKANENGDMSATRVELNRANDRQRRTKDYYAKQINKALEEENERYAKSKAKGVVNKDSSQLQANRELESTYSNLAKFRAFDGFINPAVSYISGLFFALNGDNKGIDYLKESYGITQNESIAQDILYLNSADFRANAESSRAFRAMVVNAINNDLAESENDANNESSKIYEAHKDELEKLDSMAFYTWILLEEGRQAHKKEFKFSLPIITSNGLYHFGIALPQFVEGVSFANSYGIESSPKSTHTNTESIAFDELANTDNIIATEFEKQLKTIIARAFVSASLKVATQLGLSKGLEQVNSGLGLLGSIFGSAYSMLSTNADLRIASVLPHKILLAKMQNAKISNQTPNDKESKEDFSYEIFADRAKIASIDFSLSACYEMWQANSQNQLDKDNKTKAKKHEKRGAILLCPYTHNIVYLRHTKAKTYHKILFSR
ncbi:hypothetical protein [Helicobacter sp. T3_23-1056]